MTALLGPISREKTKEGFFMAREIPNSPQRGSSRFQQVIDVFLSAPGLPFAEVLSADRIERIFGKHDCRFGRHGVYTTAIMV